MSEKSTTERITWVHRWSPGLISFRLSRSPDYRFAPGQFARLSLRVPEASADAGTKQVSRAYSMVSGPDEDFLEFYLIVIPGGEFSSRIAAMQVGDEVEVERAPYGFLTVDRFLDPLSAGRELWLLATGTGLSPYLSIARDPATWAQWERVILVHSVRTAAELAYRDLIADIGSDPRWGGAPGKRLTYVPVVTRDPGDWLAERIPRAIESGALEQAAGCTLAPEHSRVMICGNPEMVKATRATLAKRGFQSPRRGNPGNLVVENYW
ncbi:MAG: ferredoxin--NADP reductase [Burkholderiaceae bacterium]